jgi:hypothetical protein
MRVNLVILAVKTRILSVQKCSVDCLPPLCCLSITITTITTTTTTRHDATHLLLPSRLVHARMHALDDLFPAASADPKVCETVKAPPKGTSSKKKPPGPCPNCGKTFTSGGGYDYHVSKKVCFDLSERNLVGLACHLCGKVRALYPDLALVLNLASFFLLRSPPRAHTLCRRSRASQGGPTTSSNASAGAR